MNHCHHDSGPRKYFYLIDEYTRECLAIVAERRLNYADVRDICYEVYRLRDKSYLGK